MHVFEFPSIGTIESCFKERFGTPRQPGLVTDAWAILHLHSEFNLAEGLQGLEGFSHIWVIFVFHQNTNKGLKLKVHPPRLEGEKIGVFATRSPHRPNPIGLSAVKLEKIEGNKVYVSGGDFVDGTPVLDIKPYVPFADSRPDAQAQWAQISPQAALQVVFSDQAQKDILRHPSPTMFTQMIRQTLELDPRPGFYKGTVEKPNPYMDTYGFCLEDHNIVYKVEGRTATVLRLE